ncbi:hypothetical protein ANN_24559 [Periplaneta americana]|uniref:Uncharacterized protein n=1 Tax=Periplaneta americana TaxID=6978 RepID=A0ABQ8S3E3_PERAM|nr:hypothetical protein ANN_24559 [Periplaneta americana]
MSPGSSTESYPAFAHIGLRENPGKNLNQVTCPDRESNPGHLVSRPDALTVTPQCKRQIFREQVLPHSGGKIPDDAFRADRLALNRLNKDGISVPDGIVLDARRRDKHPTLRHNSDLEMSVIKVVLTPEGRYVAPEGRYHYPNPITVDSTYIIRPPIGNYKHELRQRPTLSRRPIPAPLELPNKHEQTNSNLPLYLGIQDNNAGYIFQSHHGLFSDHFYPFYTPQV